MTHIIRVYCENKIFSIDLSIQSGASIGSGTDDTVCLDAQGLSDNHIRFINKDGNWMIKARRNVYRGNSRISSENLSEGAMYSVQTEPPIYLSVHPKQDDGDKAIKLDLCKNISIGRDQGNDIVLCNMRTSSKHCRIYKVGEGYKIQDCGSKNGTFVNGTRISEKVLCDGDIINISVYCLKFENNRLSLFNVGNDVVFHIETEERVDDDNDRYDEEKHMKSDTISLYEIKKDEEKTKKGTVSVFDF